MRERERDGIKPEMLDTYVLALLSFAFEVVHVCISLVVSFLGFVTDELNV